MVSDLTFGYEESADVLRDATLAVGAGEAVGLLGANGSGKSTMLGAITNSVHGERSGRIAVADAAVGPIGFATQNVALYLHLTVRENLVHAARLSARRWQVGDLVERAVDEYGLAGFVEQSARTISGGQARISHLACSFVHQPSIRLLDEPTTALDFETRQKLIDLVHRWRTENIATVVTAHYPEDIEELCTSLVVLVDGETHALGPIERHLHGLGATGTITREGASCDIEVVEPTLQGLTTAAAAAGIGVDDRFETVRVSPPSLRDLLRKDPSLRTAVESGGGD